MAKKVRYLIVYPISGRKAPYGFSRRESTVSYLEERGFIRIKGRHFRNLFWQPKTARLAEIMRSPPKKGA